MLCKVLNISLHVKVVSTSTASTDRGAECSLVRTLLTLAGPWKYCRVLYLIDLRPIGGVAVVADVVMRNYQCIAECTSIERHPVHSMYLRGRTAVLKAPLDSSWSETDKSKKQRTWLKQEALRYIGQLCLAVMYASPSDEWIASNRERLKNSHHIFFAARDNHRTCPALLDYRPKDLPETGELDVNQ
jgi:hypothetical protein